VFTLDVNMRGGRAHGSLPDRGAPLAFTETCGPDNGSWRSTMGDRGKKEKEKGQKQHAAKDKQEEKRKLERQPKRTA
jgi:hypothetical protein